ncbi:unnamed protein product [Blepharisma stoltei]|uniref:Chaperone protein DnaJ n=1 Tax=Blepharisma stoltei TaxID=1481888 RepID=A0AAU9K7Y5_9CILI|nr:unnamed protein product [Blepharisma stoltei]
MILLRGFRSSLRLLNKKDYYKILGISSNASQSDIKKAYFELAKKYHPDVNKSLDAKAKFAEINNAYETLGDLEKRKAYDNTGMTGDEQEQAKASGFNASEFNGFNPFGNFTSKGFTNNFTGFQDIFSEFGDFFGQGASNHDQSVYQGEDIVLTMEISFLEAVNGVSKQIILDKRTICKACKGTKVKPGSSPVKCDLCGGLGVIVFQKGPITIQTTCKNCQGIGKIIKSFCTACKGTGIAHERHTDTVIVPPGINTGSSLKIKGGGNFSENGDNPGDLLIKFIVKPHPVFKRIGYDIHSEVSLSVSQAALGGTIDVETLAGNIKLKVEPGTNPGQTVKLASQGISHLPPHQTKKGDHYIKFTVVIPKHLTREERRLYEQLAKLNDEKS